MYKMLFQLYLHLGVPEIIKLFGAIKLPTKPLGKPSTLASVELLTVYEILVRAVLLQTV